MRQRLVTIALLLYAIIGVGAYLWPPVAFAFGPLVILTIVGVRDMTQRRHTILRNFPVIGHGRYLMEGIRPELNQYFIESNTDGSPFSRELRSVVYQRAKGQMDTVPFGTQLDLYEVGAEWLTHSIVPKHVVSEDMRVMIGKGTCEQPYCSSLLNISAMSYGSLSKNAVLALSKGAKSGGFAHNTGEGGVSPHHLAGGADLIWQVGTGYFGCRTEDGGFDASKFQATASHEQVKMIEIKLSQGAKPAHGGILPAGKVTPEVSKIRGVPMGKDVNSPPGHRAFHTPKQLLSFVTRLRELSGGKPIGIKLCVGKRREFFCLCKAMVETDQYPDYIAVDGAEGGTGAAPLEFSNRLGLPLTEAVIFVHNALVGIGFRERIRIIASGKVATGFDMVRLLALGADATYSARAMMMAIGCIQARRCNSNDCPAGVATQDPKLVHGLDVDDKAKRTARYHAETVESCLDLLGACGFDKTEQLRPWNVQRRVAPTEVRHYGELYTYLAPRALLEGNIPEELQDLWKYAAAESFEPITSDGSDLPPPISQVGTHLPIFEN